MISTAHDDLNTVRLLDTLGEERHEVVASMREIGMSTRAIASATGNDRKTIMADAREVVQNGPPATDRPAITGTDGNNRGHHHHG